MKKIIFCNIAWMKNYCGITEDDKPYNGGSYVEENGDAAESCNFLPNNHYCYGYFASKGQNLNLSRVDKTVGKDVSMIAGVTVIWVANRKIVGWYENAEMYRKMQEFYDDILGDDKVYWLYNFKAHENDVYLLPTEFRNFDIPSASVEGTGKGMGQSNIWYADSEWARKMFVPEVLGYIRIMSTKCVQNIITAEQINEKAQYSPNFDVETLFRRAKKWTESGNFLEALKIYNLMDSKVNAPQNSCLLKFQRGNMLQSLFLYDEAVELYKQFLYDFDQLDNDEKTAQTIGNIDLQITNLDCMWCLACTYMAMKQYFAACSIFQKYLEIETETELKCYALWRLMYIFNDEQDWKHLREAIEIYEKLDSNILDEDVEWYREILSKQ